MSLNLDPLTPGEAERLRTGDRSRALYERARVLMDAGRLQEAVATFNESIALYPHFKCLELLGECYLQLNRPSDAIVPLAAASRLNRQVRAPSLLSLALLRIGEARRAGELALEVLATAPGNAAARTVLSDPDVVRALSESDDDGAA